MPQNGFLLKPFLESPWKGASKEAAQALWAWHDHLARVNAGAPTEEELDSIFEQEAERVTAHQPMTLLPNPVWRAAYETCEKHDIPTKLLVSQLQAARRFCGPLQFANASAMNDFMAGWVIPHGHALAHLANAASRWQMRPVAELSRAFFMVNRLLELPRHVRKGWLFIPVADMEQANVSLDELERGEMSERMERLLWKQCIRARDAFAQGIGLQGELERPMRKELKKFWLLGLEVMNEIERNKYNVWEQPVRLGLLHRVQVRVQAIIGRGVKRG